MPRWCERVHDLADRSCSVVVVALVAVVNVYALRGAPASVVVPCMTVACCATAVVTRVLKRRINQLRPVGAPRMGPGMPSSHATSLSFLAVATVVGLQHGAPLLSSSSYATRQQQRWSLYTCAQVAVVAYSVYAMWLRVHARHHTRAQVVVGACIGSASAVVCLVLNYAGYHGHHTGGRIDALPHEAKRALLLVCGGVCAATMRTILRNSALLRKTR